MSELLLEPTRRAFLKGTGALVVSFSIDAAVSPAAAQLTPEIKNTKVLDSWIAIHANNTATVYLGKVELGQGNSTALLQMVADELDMDLAQVSAARVDSVMSGNQGLTGSSSSVRQAGPQLRAAAAEARQELLRRASEHLKAPVDSLAVSNGVVSAGTSSVSYGALLGDKPFNLPFTGKAPLKKPAEFRLMGKPVARRDIAAKVTGSYGFMQHEKVPGMLHGRVVRPRGQGAYGQGAKVISVDEASIRSLRGVRVVRKGDFIGVVAPRQWDAIRAAQMLRVKWDLPETLPGNAGLHAKMRSGKTKDAIIVNDGDADKAASQAPHVASGTYHAPYQAHGPFSPSCALASMEGDTLVVKCSSQDVFALHTGRKGHTAGMAPVLGLPMDKLRVQFVDGAGCFGHSGYDDAAFAAAIMAQATGKPVRVQFMQWDEIGWDNFGPAHVADVKISADKDGRLVSYQYHGWAQEWMIEETSEQLYTGKPVTVWTAESPLALSVILNKWCAGGMYAVANRHLVNHAVNPLDGYPKGSWLRAPMDLAYAFASEQTMDKLAAEVGLDPVEFRRRNIEDARWRGVLEAAAKAANWQPRKDPAPTEGAIAKGRGVGLGTHRESMGGCVAEVEVNRSTGQVVAKRLFVAMDCGYAINPDIVASQIMGMAVQGTSRMLKEEVAFSKTGVTSLDWNSYPVLRFAEHPEVVPIVISDPANRPLGAGEEALPAVGAAIANAVYDAIGVRFTEYPITPERVLAALRR